MAKFCANCGQQLEDNDVFCGNCGTGAEPAEPLHSSFPSQFDDSPTDDFATVDAHAPQQPGNPGDYQTMIAQEFDPSAPRQEYPRPVATGGAVPINIGYSLPPKQKTGSRKGLIIGLCAAFVVILTVVIIVVASSSSGSVEKAIRTHYDSYFKKHQINDYIDTKFECVADPAERADTLRVYESYFSKTSQRYLELVEVYGVDFSIAYDMLSDEPNSRALSDIQMNPLVGKHVSEVRNVTFAITISGNNRTSTKTINTNMYKYDGKWCVGNALSPWTVFDT